MCMNRKGDYIRLHLVVELDADGQAGEWGGGATPTKQSRLITSPSGEGLGNQVGGW